MARRKDLMKRLYCETLLELCAEKPLGKISVSDVVARASTARQTFYNHFQDINDLISYLPINYIAQALPDVYDRNAVLKAYTYAAENAQFFCQLPSHVGQNSFRETFTAWMEQLYRDVFITDGLSAEEALQREIAIVQYSTGVVESFLEWCRRGLDWPVEVLVQVQDDALPDFVREAQGNNSAS